jgi:hypothetical protein
VPPVACRTFEYAEPMIAAGRDDELIVKGVGVAGAAATDRAIVAVAVCAAGLESTTVTSNE